MHGIIHIRALPAKNLKDHLLIGKSFLGVFDLATRYLHDNQAAQLVN